MVVQLGFYLVVAAVDIADVNRDLHLVMTGLRKLTIEDIHLGCIASSKIPWPRQLRPHRNRLQKLSLTGEQTFILRYTN